MTLNRPHPFAVLIAWTLAVSALLWCAWLAGCEPVHTVKTRDITSPTATPAVTPYAEKTFAQTGRVVIAIDGATATAEQVNDLDPAKKPLITGLTNARREAVVATEQAKETRDRAEAKDGEAKAAQSALIEALKEMKDLALQVGTEKARADKAQAFIDEHKDDLLGPKVHRFIRALTFWTILGLSIGAAAIIGIGVVGSMYGLPALTKPVFGSLGGLLDGVRFLLYKAASVIWSFIPGVGHFADETLNTVGKYRAMEKPTAPNIQHPIVSLASPANDPLNVTPTPAT